MKVARCIVTRREIKNMIHELQNLEKLYSNPAVKSRFVASKFLQATLDPGPIGKMLKQTPKLLIILAMDREAGKPIVNQKSLPQVPNGSKDTTHKK